MFKLKYWWVYSIILVWGLNCFIGIERVVETVSAQEIQEKLFYNPTFSYTLEAEVEILEYLPYVIDNYFICFGENKRDKVDYEHKIELSEEELTLIQENLKNIESIAGECRDFLDRYKDIFPLDKEKRQEICGYLARILEECVKLELEICGNRNLGIEGIIFKNFRPISDFEEKLNEDNRSKEYFSYMRGLKGWYYGFEYSFRVVDKRLKDYYWTEYALNDFSKKGFILEGNAKRANEFSEVISPYFYKAREIKNFPFIKDWDGDPLSREEMKALSVEGEDDLNKIIWSPLILEGSGRYTGIIFRDNPSFDSDSLEIMEFYDLGPIQTPFNMIDVAFNSLPEEIRWIDKEGKTHIMWAPFYISPLNFFPQTKDSLY